MAEMKNHLDLYKLLPGTNCKKCDSATCLAFAVEVMQGRKKLEQCPFVKSEVLETVVTPGNREKAEREKEERRALAALKSGMEKVDLGLAAQRLGAPMSGDRIIIHSLGKPFEVDGLGNMASNCHVNQWVLGPILKYIISGEGREPSGDWVPFRELTGGRDWDNFFTHRCEKPLAKLADKHTDLFEDLIYLFDGTPTDGSFDSDISLILHPLPRVPIHICYWRPDDGMGSQLNIFFDQTASRNLGVESIYTLLTGMLIMFEKIARRHA